MPRPPRRATRLALAAATTALALPLTPTRAADLSWSSPTSGRWLDPTNWSTGTVPTSADSATLSDPGPYVVTLDGSTHAGPVTLNSPGSILSVANKPNASLDFLTGDLTVSAGTLAFHSTTGMPLRLYTSSISNAGTLTLDADSVYSYGTPLVDARTASGNIINSGTIEAHAAPTPPHGPYYPTIYTFSGATGSTFTNTGTLRAVGASGLHLDYYTLNQNAGSLGGDVELFNGALNYNGGSCSPTTPVYLGNSALSVAPTATNGNFFLDSGSSITTDIPTGNTVRTWSNVRVQKATGTDPTFTNAGRLILGYYTQGTSSYIPTFFLGSSSTLLNTGTLEFNSPNLPPATLTGSITNQGTVTVNAASLSSSGVPTAISGSFTQNAGGSLTVDPTTSLSLTNSHFYFNAGTVTGPVALNNSTVHFAPGLASTGTGTFAYSTTTSTSPASPFAGDIPSGATVVHTTGIASFFPLPSFTNAGTLLTSYATGARPDYRLDNYTGTLTNTGTIGGTLYGVDHGAYLEIDGNLVNTGTIKANFLTVAGSFSPTGPHPSFDQNAGTLDVDNLCLVFHATFNYNGGTLTGKPVGINASTLNIAPDTNPASFIFYAGSNTFHGNISPGSTLALDTFLSGTTVSVTADPFTNAGTLSLAATTGPVTSTLTVNGTLTNTGTLSVTAGKGGTRTLNANVLNTGTLSIGPNATLTLAGSLSTTTPLDLQGTLDLRGPLTWSYTSPSPIDTLRSLLAAGHLTDSAADPSHRLAYTDTGTSLNVSLALTGDTNLDGQITPDDYALLDRSYARSLSDAHWTDGDFNYDGTVDQNDYLLIDTTLAQSQGLSPTLLSTRESQFGPAYVSTLLASVPEPASLTTLLLLLPLTRRRRRTLKIRRTFQ